MWNEMMTTILPRIHMFIEEDILVDSAILTVVLTKIDYIYNYLHGLHFAA
jgi:hypothetical protein